MLAFSGEPLTTSIVCLQAGSTFNHECTVSDWPSNPLGSTIWTGNAFNCSDSINHIQLPHSSYDHESGVTSACGDFSAMSVSVQETEYTSRLTFLGNSALLNGTAINCTKSGTMLVETVMIKVGGKLLYMIP